MQSGAACGWCVNIHNFGRWSVSSTHIILFHSMETAKLLTDSFTSFCELAYITFSMCQHFFFLFLWKQNSKVSGIMTPFHTGKHCKSCLSYFRYSKCLCVNVVLCLSKLLSGHAIWHSPVLIGLNLQQYLSLAGQVNR